MPINSGDKGKDYERNIAKSLSTWCGFELIRTPMSGAWQGTAGDIKPKDESQQFPFVIECKKQEDWSLEQILSGRGLFQAWVKQANEEIIKDRANGRQVRTFMLIFSRNHKPNYVALPTDQIIKTMVEHAYLSSKYPPPNTANVMCDGVAMIIYELKSFLEYFKFSDLI